MSANKPSFVSAEIEWEEIWNTWRVTPQMLTDYKEIFDDISKDAFITGDQARMIFASSGLPKDVLGRIWSLADRNRDQKLDFKEYVLAMFLIKMKQEGKSLPATLPSSLIYSVYPEERPANDPQFISVEEDVKELSISDDPSKEYKTVPHILDIQKGQFLSPSPKVRAKGGSLSTSPSKWESPQDYSVIPSVPGASGRASDSTSYGQASPARLPAEYQTIPNVITGDYQVVKPYGEMPTPQQARAMSLSSPSSPFKQKLNESGRNRSSSTSPGVSADDLPSYTEVTRTFSSSSSLGGTESEDSDDSEAFEDEAPPPPENIEEIEWKEYRHKDGRLYYYNKKTGKSQWDQPARFIPASIKRGSILNSSQNMSASRNGSNGEVPTPPKNDSSGLLLDPSRADFFKKFLEAEGNNYDMLFLMDIEDFHRKYGTFNLSKPLTQEEIQQATVIYSKYISKDAAFKINLSEAVRKKLIQEFKDGQKGKSQLQRDFFNEAYKEINSRMNAEQLPRFMKSTFYIAMYNSILNRSQYELPDELWKVFTTACEGGIEDGWEYVNETKGVIIHKRKYNGWTGTCIRGSGIIQISPEEMHKLVSNVDLRLAWDKQLLSAHVVEKLDETSLVIYYAFRKPKLAVMLNSHDFVTLRAEKKYPDGSSIVISRSIVHQNVPEKKGYTRSELDIGGFLIKPCGNNACVAIYVNQTELKGIPKMIEDALVTKRAMAIYNIRKFIEKEMKESQKKNRPPIWKRL